MRALGATRTLCYSRTDHDDGPRIDGAGASTSEVVRSKKYMSETPADGTLTASSPGGFGKPLWQLINHKYHRLGDPRIGHLAEKCQKM
jgi:hypothetical protein